MINPVDDLPKLISRINDYDIQLPIIRKRLQQFQTRLITGGRETLSQETTEILHSIREIHCEQRLSTVTHSQLKEQIKALKIQIAATKKDVHKRRIKIDDLSCQLVTLQKESAELDRKEAQLNLEHITTRKTLEYQKNIRDLKASEMKRSTQSTEDEELSGQKNTYLAKQVKKLNQELERKTQDLMKTQKNYQLLSTN